ncbi:hypothetical protein NPIL_513841, partial [Nephila pilipes]
KFVQTKAARSSSKEVQQKIQNIMFGNTDLGKIPCTLCKRSFENARLIKSHRAKHHYIRKCPNCRKIYQSTKLFLCHLRTHLNNCPYDCRICLKSFNEKYLLRVHMEEHKHPKKKICKVCSAVCYHHYSLKRHLQTHKGKPYKCTMCDSTFSSVGDRVRHINNHVIRCGLCYIPLKNEGALCEHIKAVHQTEKGETSVEEQPLKDLDVVVNAECDSSDSMAESSSSEGESYCPSNDDIVPVYNARHKDKFICFICLQLCSSPETLKYHMEAHMWFPCRYCTKFFSSKRDLDEHMEDHPYGCTRCNVAFKYVDDLNLHLKKCSEKSKRKEERNETVSNAINKNSDVGIESKKDLKELGRNLKMSCNTMLSSIKESGEVSSFHPNDALSESVKRLLEELNDEVLCINNSDSISIKYITHLIQYTSVLKFPVDHQVLRQLIYIEQFIGSVLQRSLLKNAPMWTETCRNYLQDVYSHLSDFVNGQLYQLQESLEKKARENIEEALENVNKDIEGLKEQMLNGHEEPKRAFMPSLAMIKLLTFDVKTSWQVYRTQFTMVVEANGCNSRVKAFHLADSLREDVARHP